MIFHSDEVTGWIERRAPLRITIIDSNPGVSLRESKGRKLGKLFYKLYVDHEPAWVVGIAFWIEILAFGIESR